MKSIRYEDGLKRLKEVDGVAGDRVIEALADICPDLGTYIIEFGFGDVYSRPGLTLQQRELATVAALTAIGTAEAQLKVHLAAALNVGLSRTEIIETIVQMSLYAGFPAALNGLFAAKEVFAQHPR
jgi:4-carboxymuconolactone decarboxylase